MIDNRTDPRLQFKVKQVTEVVNNSSVLQDDDELYLPVLPNRIYRLDLVLFVVSNTNQDFKAKLVMPAGSSGSSMHICQTSAISTVALGSTINQSTTGSDEILRWTGILITGATAGNVQLQWCQNLAAANDTKVYQGSSIELCEV